MFTTPLGLLALLAIPAIVAIHLFRRRFPVRPVAGLFLWQIVRQTPEGGGRIARLPITTSLILECLAALALALILAGARLSSAGVSEHLVVLLDDSASMAAVNARGESARDRAVRRVLAEVDRAWRRARVTLVRAASGPRCCRSGGARRPKRGPRSRRGNRRRRIIRSRSACGWRASSRADRQADGRQRRRRRRPRQEDDVEGALWVSVGEPLANVGITAAQRTLSPAEGRGTVSLTLGNYSDAAGAAAPDAWRRATRSVADQGARRAAGISSLTLPLPAGLPAVRVALSDDALARDNEVMLAEPRPQIVGVENRLPEGRGRQALVKALDAVSGVTRAESGHLVFVEAATLDRAQPPGVWRVGFGRPPAAWLARASRRDFVGPFVLEKRHPLLLGDDARRRRLAGATAARPVPCVRWCPRAIRCSSACLTCRPAPGPSRRFSSTSISIAPISFDRPTGRS